MYFKFTLVIIANLLQNLAMQFINNTQIATWLTYSARVINSLLHNSPLPNEPVLPVKSPLSASSKRWLSFAIVNITSVADMIAMLDDNDFGKDDNVARILRKIAGVLSVFTDDASFD